MKNKKKPVIAVAIALLLCGQTDTIRASGRVRDHHPLSRVKKESIVSAKKINPTTVELLYADQNRLTIDFYSDFIFRLFQDNEGGIVRDPQANPPAKILKENPRKALTKLEVSDQAGEITITTSAVKIVLNKATQLFKVINPQQNVVVLSEIAPVVFEKDKVTLTFREEANEFFYGGGVQNGRFSHKGKVISIENQNSWTDGGVASPTPFYWSTAGYGFMAYTFKKGKYDFGAGEKGKVKLYHETPYLDVFIMIGDGAVAQLNNFYQLTGNPVLLPKFGFYQGHLNAYNRDYWKEDQTGILFEDGKHYKESQKDNGGIKESLNGEKGNYPFSARAVIDRYKHHDMPLGWILPNDGYGAGYGQTETLDGNIQNLKSFGDYARKNGVEIGLWTQSDLYPKPGIAPLLQRDIVKEVRDAGVRVLKTDVAWVGAGYSFGLNGVANVGGQIMPYYGNAARPFIISLDGWAGTQRYAGIWSGDQTGGQWEYIRFHIPTYLGSGLSGQPNITSDMDGIFGGKNPVVNTRDFQWKTFTPMQLNMDGWGTNEKYPHALSEPVTSINRFYLKLKSALMPYAYSIAREAVDGLPMIRSLFLAYPNAYTYGKATQYQFLYGPNFLVAPIYQATAADEKGNDIRNGIYLPEGTWIDYFSGERFEGGRVLNNYDAPLWKLPVFVKAGAIIPMVNPNNNPSEINKKRRIFELYPAGKTSFTLYDDDGISEAYKAGYGVTTRIESEVDDQVAVITIKPSAGDFEGFDPQQATEFHVNVTRLPKAIAVSIGSKKVVLTAVHTYGDYEKGENVYFYDAQPNLNRFATKGSDFEKVAIVKNPQLLVKLGMTDIRTNEVRLTLKGYSFTPVNHILASTGSLSQPKGTVMIENAGPYTLTPTWDKVANADYYDILFNDILYSTIKSNALLFEGLQPETSYTFKLRAVNKDGHSDWTTFTAGTKSDPLEFAVKGILAESKTASQGGEGLNKLVDFDENSLWHSRYGTVAVPFDVVMDLKTVNQLEKFQYLPRIGAGNGAWLNGTVYYSSDKQNWVPAGEFSWVRDDKTKEFIFKDQPLVRYLKLSVSKAVGDYGSGREVYVFKVPGSASYLQGDINNDKKIDRNDLTSYMNYTGLRKGDADFEGYISNGDINKNGLIDAYDISVVATQLDGGIKGRRPETLAGKLVLATAKMNYAKGEVVEIQVKGDSLSAVNALSFALPYESQDYEFVGIEAQQMAKMENLTYDRLHSNGAKVLYPTFVNIGQQETLQGSSTLFTIKLKARRNVKFNLKATDGILVDRGLNMLKF